MSSRGYGNELSRSTHSVDDFEKNVGVFTRSDHDPYEVSFDGDQDPMCPRRMPLAQKWLIVVIICTGTLCV